MEAYVERLLVRYQQTKRRPQLLVELIRDAWFQCPLEPWKNTGVLLGPSTKAVCTALGVPEKYEHLVGATLNRYSGEWLNERDKLFGLKHGKPIQIRIKLGKR